MEIQNSNQINRKIIRYLVFTQNVFIITSFLNFIDQQDLQAIATVAVNAKRQGTFFRIVVAKLFVNSYLNRVDRSIFFLFYDQPYFQNIEKNTINALASNSYQFLEKAYHSFQTILSQLSHQFDIFDSRDELTSIIQTIFFQPDIPMPKMKRQTIGMYCETAFQEYLCLRKFSQANEAPQLWFDQSLEELRTKLQGQTAIGLQTNILNLPTLMETVRFRGWLINANTWKNFLAGSFYTHNLIVIFLALSSELVDTYYVFLTNIKDPFMSFIEFNLRSTIYRNIILAIQERFAFVFTHYDKIYSNIYQPAPQIPRFNFWRAALSIWAQRMSCYHSKNRKIYDYITAKLRENSLLRYLSSKTERLPSVYSELREEAELNGFSQVLKDQAYHQNQGGLEMESYFEDNQEMYRVLAKDYLEYSVDLSINEINVHWCGYSQHAIGNCLTYKEVSSSLVQSSMNYYRYLKSLVENTMTADLKIITFRQILKEDIHFISEEVTKPYTVRILTDLANSILRQLVQLIGQSTIFVGEVMSKYRILTQFQQKDNLLTYFAQKAQIAQDCPKTMKFYYNVQGDPTVEIPKAGVEYDSQLSSEDHDIYESEGESM